MSSRPQNSLLWVQSHSPQEFNEPLITYVTLMRSEKRMKLKFLLMRESKLSMTCIYFENPAVSIDLTGFI